MHKRFLQKNEIANFHAALYLSAALSRGEGVVG